ncbi:phosphotyrosine protein phosphatase [Autumnicola edwardsiae]|uniref:Phosphotyrosine protein phosphatase n=1 Tax=Autumnicola edwardsiae TaxID=3075594 RepID=A0ABU3CY28_9FLAO|nr:phosphotyrosine protein phosphatase [Zunongwangia sp. F297]MDT0651234.1 phosphotyrosine protein phosphatase [Zunongwangia sp. F297]
MNYLFICSANKQRSKTAEDFFAQKYPEYKFLSAGTNVKICRKEGTTELTEDLLEWADKVYVMEKKHLEQIQKNTGSKYYSKINVLNIPDIYKYYDADLITILEEKVSF